METKFYWKCAALFGLVAQMLSAQISGMASGIARGNAPDLVPRATTGPGIIPIGSPLTFGGTNAPDTYAATTTFSSTPVVVDNGAVKIWQNQVPTGSNGEWDIFYMQTTNGGPLAGNISANWNITMSYTLSAAIVFDAVAQQWGVNGTPVTPVVNFGSICCAAASNPILPGESYYNSGFSAPFPAGVFMNWQQVYVDPYSFLQSGGINPATANTFTFALHFTLQPAGPTVTSAISASQYGAFPNFGSGSWIEIYGTNFAVAAQEWGNSDFNGLDAPIKLSGTSVSIGGQSAFVEYISPGQINAQVPAGVSNGSQPLVVTTASGASPPFTVNIASEAGLLAPPSFNIGGTQYVVALLSDGSYALPTGAIAGVASRPAKPGETILLYGVGFGPVNTFVPPGQIAEGQSMLAANFTMSIGGTPATVSYDGLVATYVGLYQFNVVVPSVPANNAAPLTFSLGGVNGTQQLSIAIGN